ncbi:hypothetical protein [Edaphobacter modestus]|uniref:Uncharacterized protein n=1 Tax=Edaphobacter modestus TaxID=388466 RepID=A0A4Q7YQQ0_9BACT|nr:hypothetical protein [Edaphobacter modestus]RZU39231.1 hypothetical protein BDD14_0583 [Edaphobacter modestus]
MLLKTYRVSLTIRFMLLALIIPLVACRKSEKPSINMFASPDDAGSTLLAVAKSGDQTAL